MNDLSSYNRSILIHIHVDINVVGDCCIVHWSTRFPTMSQTNLSAYSAPFILLLFCLRLLRAKASADFRLLLICPEKKKSPTMTNSFNRSGWHFPLFFIFIFVPLLVVQHFSSPWTFKSLLIWPFSLVPLNFASRLSIVQVRSISVYVAWKLILGGSLGYVKIPA
jgi:hypothetical protein